jgi:acyl transferase domain-containing protein
MDDMSYTYHVGRKHFECRKSIVFQDREELIDLLSQTTSSSYSVNSQRTKAVVFMFSGAGSQYVNMGRDLYDKEIAFREKMDEGFSILQAITGEDYKSIIYSSEIDDFRINKMLHTQPLIFLFEYALAKLMISWGIQPHYMIGHSIGEYVAACVSGVFNYEDALKLIVRRGQLMDRMPSGSMISASMPQVNIVMIGFLWPQ